MRTIMLLVLLLMAPTVAHAKWRMASSDHFVIYGNSSEDSLRKFAENLEKYHAAMAFVMGVDQPPPSPSNRVTIYAVGTDQKVKNLYMGDSSYVGGFYLPRAAGSIAIVPQVPGSSSENNQGLQTFLHEYAHHFLIGSLGLNMPRWVSEGAAEFYSSASFERDGTVSIGRPAGHRAHELVYAKYQPSYSKSVPLRAVLDEEQYDGWKKKGYDSFYGQSWLLFHYLYFSKERQGQYIEYTRLISSGMKSIDAATKAFGDLDVLEEDLSKYLKQRKMLALYLTPERLGKIGSISIRPLTPAYEEAMPLVFRTRAGVTKEMAAEVVAEARKLAAKYPDDPDLLAELAEAEFDAGFDDQAIAAADRAIAINPATVNAYVQKGYALFRKADKSSDPDQAFAEARKPFLALNKLENDHPLPLLYNYRSYIERGADVPENAFRGLVRAAELAPFDMSLRYNVVNACIARGQLDEAKLLLRPLMNNVHGGEMAESARKLFEQLEKGEKPAVVYLPQPSDKADSPGD